MPWEATTHSYDTTYESGIDRKRNVPVSATPAGGRIAEANLGSGCVLMLHGAATAMIYVGVASYYSFAPRNPYLRVGDTSIARAMRCVWCVLYHDTCSIFVLISNFIAVGGRVGCGRSTYYRYSWTQETNPRYLNYQIRTSPSTDGVLNLCQPQYGKALKISLRSPP